MNRQWHEVIQVVVRQSPLRHREGFGLDVTASVGSDEAVAIGRDTANVMLIFVRRHATAFAALANFSSPVRGIWNRSLASRRPS